MADSQGTPSRQERLLEVDRWLSDPELSKHDDFYIARACGVPTEFVSGERNRKIHPARNSVYFMRIGLNGPIKIGFSDNPEARRNNLQTALPWRIRILATMPGRSKKSELILHQQFDHLRLRGEWFNAGEDLLEYIRRYANEYDESAVPYYARLLMPQPEAKDVVDKGERDPRELRGYMLPPSIWRIDETAEEFAWEGKSRGMTREQMHALFDRYWDHM